MKNHPRPCEFTQQSCLSVLISVSINLLISNALFRCTLETLFGSSVDPDFLLLVLSMAPFSPRLARHDGRAQRGTDTGVCTDGSTRVCEKRKEKESTEDVPLYRENRQKPPSFNCAKREREKDGEISELVSQTNGCFMDT